MASKDTSPRRREVSPTRPLQYQKQKRTIRQDKPSEQKMAYPQQPRLGGAQFPQRNREYADNGKMRDCTPVLASNAYSALGDCVQIYFKGNETPQNTYSASGSASASGAEHSNSSSSIIGDFIPIDTEGKKVSLRTRKDMASSDPSRQLALPANPYEFDPASPDIRVSHQTRITDFIQRPGSSPASYSTPRMGHFKNAHSQDNTQPTRRRPTQLAFDSEQNTRHDFHRSPSPDDYAMEWAVEAPNPTVQRLAAEYGALVVPVQSSPIRSTHGEYGVVSPPQNRYHGDEGEFSYVPSPVRSSNRKVEGERRDASPERNNGIHEGEYRAASPMRKQRASEETARRGRQHANEHASPSYNQPHYASQSSPVRGRRAAQYDSQATTLEGYSQAYSPTDAKAQAHAHELSSRAAPYDRQQTSSPSKGLEDDYERDEMNGRYLRKDVEYAARTQSPPPSPKKRSRSPMKKLFGEKGFFGESPEEMIKQNAKRAAASSRTRTNSSSGQKKIGVMDKLKSKLGEIAEKADMTPKRTSSEKPKKTHPPISIPPPEQARILMELEYMIAQTANKFLMSQFGQGRLSIDSIRKTVDAWEARGRPKVLEFMYDQATQRNLVNTNLQELRFYGERACNHLSVSSMLYAWKNVATVMAIRTFCDADTVLKKLVFDIEQILELLGAVESIMMRVQTLREKINSLIRAARESTSSGGTSQGVASSDGQGQHSYAGRSAGDSMDDPYGGLKLVPDHYRET